MSLVKSVTLFVKDLTKMEEFYRDIIGLHVIERKENCVYFSANKTDIILILQEKSGIAERNPFTPGLYHIAFLLPKRSDLANLLAFFIEKLVVLQGASDHHVSEAIYLADPEGNGLEIYCDRPEVKWNWVENQVQMVTQGLDVRDLLATATEPWETIPEQTTIGHIHLQVANIHETEQFYQNKLAIDTTLLMGKQALFMSRDHYHHHFGFNTWQQRDNSSNFTEQQYGLALITLAVDNNWASELTNFDFNEENSILIQDPSGINLELIKEN